MRVINLSNKTKKGFSYGLYVLLVLLFGNAYYLGNRGSQVSDTEYVQKAFSEYRIAGQESDDRVFDLQKNGQTYMLCNREANGYGGRMQVGLVTDSTGTIVSVKILESNETTGYLRKLEGRGFFNQFSGKKMSDVFCNGVDLEAVSGATVSSDAIALGARKCAHFLSSNYFDTDPNTAKHAYSISKKDVVLILFFLVSILFVFVKSKTLKLISYAGSVILLGFTWNNSISITFFGRLFIGDFPGLISNFSFWIYLVFIFSGILLLKRNLFCYQVCPFFGVQYFMNKLTGIKMTVHPRIQKYSGYIQGGLTVFALLLIIVNQNPTISSFEPMSMIFSLEGVGKQWFILPVILIGSMFVPTFFCRYFCPVGKTITSLLQLRKGKFVMIPISTKPMKDCSNCPSKSGKSSLFPSLLYLLSLIFILMYLVEVI